MTVIRFARHGAKKRPVFRIVVQNKTSPRDGRFIEHIGNFTPTLADPEAAMTVDKARLQYWLSVGAQASSSVRTHLRSVFAELRLPSVSVPSSPDAKKTETKHPVSADAKKPQKGKSVKQAPSTSKSKEA